MTLKLFAECREYGNLIYETVNITNPILGECKCLFASRLPSESLSGEPTITKRENICAHTAIELIVGGTVAKEREFPHMALIGFKNGNPEGEKS